MRVSDERLAQLETLDGDAELMQEFKDGKSVEWDPDYWIRLARGEDEVRLQRSL